MRHCCQLIPLQITRSFIVSSLSRSPAFSGVACVLLARPIVLSFSLSFSRNSVPPPRCIPFLPPPLLSRSSFVPRATFPVSARPARFKRCTWDRKDKRNCANKFAVVDNCCDQSLGNWSEERFLTRLLLIDIKAVGGRGGGTCAWHFAYTGGRKF